MFSDAKRYFLYQVGNAMQRPYPYPHLYLTDVLPSDYYAAMRRNLPARDAYSSLADSGRVTRGAYRERSIFFFEDKDLAKLAPERAAFWREFSAWFLDEEVMGLLIAKFDGPIQQRFANCTGNVTLKPEAYLVKDETGYAIGPHTDAPHRLLSLLLYIPADDRWQGHGTSLYLPRDRQFTCAGGPHYKPEPFDRIATMPYVPNALFAFPKTETSFHGVEPVAADDIERDLILYDVRLEGHVTQDPATRSQPTAAEARP